MIAYFRTQAFVWDVVFRDGRSTYLMSFIHLMEHVSWLYLSSDVDCQGGRFWGCLSWEKLNVLLSDRMRTTAHWRCLLIGVGCIFACLVLLFLLNVICTALHSKIVLGRFWWPGIAWIQNLSLKCCLNKWVFDCFRNICTLVHWRTSSGSRFHNKGAANEKALSPVLVRALGWQKSSPPLERRGRAGW